MKVYIVWESVEGYPEEGAGDYLKEIFANEDDAREYCTQLNQEPEDSSTYYIEEWEVK